MPFPLLQTKLYIPPPRPQLVARPAITTKLQASATYPLTLIAAPAGFGKTTLVSEWITQTAQPVAWLSLDEEDNDPGRFLLYLVAALRTVHPQIGEITLSALQAPQLPPSTAILTPLLNDLHQLPESLALVLDDYHLISAPLIHEALVFLVEHLPPTLRLIIITRLDPPLPLARWRVRGQLAEIRADDLRFDTTEAGALFNQIMGLQLTAEEIVRLETRTEGWIAGLQLAALSMQGRADITGFIQRFSGSHRHVFSYLIEEVLSRRPVGTLDFLLQTALLERFNADLCNAVTGLTDSQALLEKIEQANLFLIPLDDERKWYRYHHLFAEVLREHLHQAASQTIPTLHQRAAAWFETQELWPESIYHALAAADYATAARLIERVGLALFAQSNIQHSIQRWLSSLPGAFIDERPRLCLLQAWMSFSQVDLATGLQWVTKAEAAAEGVIVAETAAMRAMLTAYSLHLDPAQALAFGQQALATLPVEQYTLRGIAAAAVGMAYVKQGALREAEAALAEAISVSRRQGGLYIFATVASNQAAVQRAQGMLHRALATCRENLAWLVQHGVLPYPTFSALYLQLADLLREQNALAEAQHYAETAIAHSDRGISPVMILLCRLGFLRIKQAQGDWGAVWQLLQEITQMAERHPTVIHQSVLPAITAQYQVATEAWSADADSPLETAWQWAQQSAWEEGKLLSAYRVTEFIYLYEHSRLARAQVYMAWARWTNDQSLLPETMAYLQRQEQIAMESHLRWYLIKVQLLQALVHHILGQSAVALSLLTTALQRAQPERFVRIFVDEGEPMRRLLAEWTQSELDDGQLGDFVEQLLIAFAQPADEQSGAETASHIETPSPTIVNRKSQIVNLVEPLSERELEILRLVAAGLSNRQLADNLIVTVGTVKKHLNNIYGKLGVASRTQAIARGRELGLLPD
ncbi:MAG: LuxR C-terminal-related transcriptional regulator [Caldilineaceae bacterium]